MPLTQEKTRRRKRPEWGIWAQLRYRLPMTVTTALELGRSGFYPLCPRCRITMDREYMSYCDRCGQKLDWGKWEDDEEYD